MTCRSTFWTADSCAATHGRGGAGCSFLSAQGLLILWIASLWTAASVEAAGLGCVPGRLLVKARPQAGEVELQNLFTQHGIKIRGSIPQIDLRILHVPPTRLAAVVQALQHDPMIEFAEPDWLLSPDIIPNDPYFGNEWHLPKISAPAAWDVTTGNNTVTIAILDSGVESSHPDLAPLLVPGWNFADNNANTADVNGHGTGVAGAAASAGNNAIGGAGVAWNCRIMPLRISDTNGFGIASAMAGALTWAADHGARVANLSYSGVTKVSSITSAAQYFQSKGGVVTASSGNESTFDDTADNPNFLLVGATDASDAIVSWSNTGSNLDLTAPGVNVLTTMRGAGYGWGSGTSFSAPIVAGVAALVLSANPALPGSEVRSLLKETADDLGAPGWDTTYGAGRVNAARAVAAALATTPGDTVPPRVVITSPSSNDTLAATTVGKFIKVYVNATDNVGVTRVDLLTDGKFYATSSLSAPVFSWNTSKLSAGWHTLQALAYDAAGNVTRSAVVTVLK